MYSSPNLCQQCIAAAEDMGVLEEYLQWVRSSKKTSCNISQLLADSIPRDSGRKAKRKCKVGTKKTSKQVEMESIEEIKSQTAPAPHTRVWMPCSENLSGSLLSATCTSPNLSFNQPV